MNPLQRLENLAGQAGNAIASSGVGQAVGGALNNLGTDIHNGIQAIQEAPATVQGWSQQFQQQLPQMVQQMAQPQGPVQNPFAIGFQQFLQHQQPQQPPTGPTPQDFQNQFHQFLGNLGQTVSSFYNNTENTPVLGGLEQGANAYLQNRIQNYQNNPGIQIQNVAKDMINPQTYLNAFGQFMNLPNTSPLVHDIGEGIFSGSPEMLYSDVGAPLLEQMALKGGVALDKAGQFAQDILSPVQEGIQNAGGMEAGFARIAGTPIERLNNLLNYPKMLLDRGYSPEMVDKISAPEASDLIKNNTSPTDYLKSKPDIAQTLTNTPETTPNGGNYISNFINSKAIPDETKQAVDEALAARFKVQQNIQMRENVLLNEVSAGVRNDEETTLFRNTIEHPENLEANMSQVSRPQEFKQAVESYRDYTDYVHSQLTDQKMQVGYLNNYYSHILDLSNPGDAQRLQEFMQNKASNFKGYFSKDRIFKNIEELQQAGFRLRNQSAQEDVVDYTNSAQKALGNQTMINKLNEGLPNSAVEFKSAGEVPRDYQGRSYLQTKIPGMEGTFVEPDVYQGIKHLEPGTLNDNGVVKAVDVANRWLKEAKLGGGLFHAYRTTNSFAGNELMNARVPNLAKAAQLFFSPKAMLSYDKDAIASGLLDKASQMGVTVGRLSDIGQFNESVLDKTISRNPLQALHRATFERVIAYYKMETVKNLNIEGLGSQEVRNLGFQVNNLFGGINYDLKGISANVNEGLRLGFLAPDYNLGKLNQILSAFKTGPAGNFARKAIIGAVAFTAIQTELFRKLTTGNFDSSFGDFVKNAILAPSFPLPYQSPTGKNLTASVPGTDVSDIATALQDPQHFFAARFSAILSLGEQLLTQKNYYGDPLTGNDVLQSVLPIPGVQLLKNQAGTQSLTTTVLNTLGLRVHTDPNDPTTKYFNNITQLEKSMDPNQQTRAAYLIQSAKNGGPDSQTRAQILMQDGAMLDFYKNVQLASNPQNPLYSRSDQDIKAYLAYQISQDPTVKAQLRIANPWIPQVQAQYAQMVQKSTGQPQTGPNPMQQLTPQQVQAVSAYTAAPKGSVQRKQILQANPWLPTYWNANSAYYQQNPVTYTSPVDQYLQSQGIAPTTSTGTSGGSYGGSYGSSGGYGSSTMGGFRNPFSYTGGPAQRGLYMAFNQLAAGHRYPTINTQVGDLPEVEGPKYALPKQSKPVTEQSLLSSKSTNPLAVPVRSTQPFGAITHTKLPKMATPKSKNLKTPKPSYKLSLKVGGKHG